MKAKRLWQAAMDYVRAHPEWRLTLQIHKLLRIP